MKKITTTFSILFIISLFIFSAKEARAYSNYYGGGYGVNIVYSTAQYPNNAYYGNYYNNYGGNMGYGMNYNYGVQNSYPMYQQPYYNQNSYNYNNNYNSNWRGSPYNYYSYTPYYSNYYSQNYYGSYGGY